jgi:hypothetical protein
MGFWTGKGRYKRSCEHYAQQWMDEWGTASIDKHKAWHILYAMTMRRYDHETKGVC